ncbi:MAG: 3-oxoacyl-[acyl-carrier-protein] synthase [Chthoniobacter sp.]|nr:3-oxoacyl-[acyl-carrier-protein] synthase [Chthoniobacter sp.]
MAVRTPIGDTPAGFLEALLAGRSAITRWQGIDTSQIEVKIGGDLSAYDLTGRMEALGSRLPESVFQRLRRLTARVPWSARLSLQMAAEAWLDAGAFENSPAPNAVATIVAGSNLNSGFDHVVRAAFAKNPDGIVPLAALHTLDTNHGACATELLSLRGPLHSVGGACASGNMALRAALDEIRHHDAEAALVLAPVLDLSPVELHSMALMGAVSRVSFNDEPHRASRPFDAAREGFVPAHGGGALVLESLERAQRRGARIYTELVGVAASSAANHHTRPSAGDEAALIGRLLRNCGVAPDQVDYVNAHAASTRLGDLAEIRAIKQAFGAHAAQLKINATKSMLGHTCWSSAIVETIAVLLQMEAGRLHPTINVDHLDPEIDLDVCANSAADHQPQTVLKNAFGFGGINCVSLLRR